MARILIPIDGSPSSLHALAHAVARRKRGERFEAVIAYVQPKVTPDRYASRALISHGQKDEFELLMSNRQIRDASRVLKAEVKNLSGDPAHEIVALAKRAHCSEIVMGTRGLGAVRSFILGSVANKVIHLSSLPVTLVH